MTANLHHKFIVIEPEMSSEKVFWQEQAWL